MIAITWGTNNEGAGQGPRNTAHTAKLLLVQINSKTQASQLKMCILTYRRHWRIGIPLQASWLSLVDLVYAIVMRAHRIGETPSSAHAAH